MTWFSTCGDYIYSNSTNWNNTLGLHVNNVFYILQPCSFSMRLNKKGFFICNRCINSWKARILIGRVNFDCFRVWNNWEIGFDFVAVHDSCIYDDVWWWVFVFQRHICLAWNQKGCEFSMLIFFLKIFTALITFSLLSNRCLYDQFLSPSSQMDEEAIRTLTYKF